MSKENINHNNYNKNEIIEMDNYIENIEKQINFLKIKFDVFEENEHITENNFKSYLRCKDKIVENKELTKIYLDEQ
jgi:hypothetical protein